MQFFTLLFNLLQFLQHWLGVLGIALCAFIFNTSEFVPVGLLSLIAQDFNISMAKAGFLMSVYAWAVACASLPLMLIFSRFALHYLMFGVVLLFILSHLALAFAPSYEILMLSRLGVACAHALFWSIATPMAVCIAPKERENLALSFVIVGTSIALLGGVPLGRVIGLYIGWRMSFLSIAIIATLIFVLLIKTLPKTPSSGALDIKSLPKILKTPKLLGIYGITMCLVTAHFIGYSYIEIYLKEIAKMQQNLITLGLVIFGSMGFLGSYLFTKYYENHQKIFSNSIFIGLFVVLLGLEIFSISVVLILIVCAFWGLFMMMFNLAFQSQLLKNVHFGVAIAMSMYSGIYNIGIGGGAYLGGVIIEKFGVYSLGYFGAFIVFFVSIYFRFFFIQKSTKVD